jgi:hypothetical protein
MEYISAPSESLVLTCSISIESKVLFSEKIILFSPLVMADFFIPLLFKNSNISSGVLQPGG